MAQSDMTTDRPADAAEIDEVVGLSRRVGQLSEHNKARFFERVADDLQRAIRSSEIRGAERAAGAGAHLGKSPDTAAPSRAGETWGGRNLRSDEITLENIDEVMVFQPWDGYQHDCGTQVREALTHAAKIILRTVPPGRFRSVTLRNIIDARMNANAGISFRGRF